KVVLRVLELIQESVLEDVHFVRTKPTPNSDRVVTHIPGFEHRVLIQLALDADTVRLGVRDLDVRIESRQRFTGCRIERPRIDRRGRSYWRRDTVPEKQRAGREVPAAGEGEGLACARIASNQLAQERNALAVVSDGITPANNRLVLTQYLAKPSTLGLRCPRNAQGRSKVIGVGVIGLGARHHSLERSRRRAADPGTRLEEITGPASAEQRIVVGDCVDIIHVLKRKRILISQT